jgi:hypothetical protein
MINKLNEVLKSIASNAKEIEMLKKHFEEKMIELQEQKKQLEVDMNLAEEVAKTGNLNFVKILIKNFTYPFNFFGGGNSSNRTYVGEELAYFTLNEAYELLSKKETICVGSGKEYHKV